MRNIEAAGADTRRAVRVDRPHLPSPRPSGVAPEAPRAPPADRAAPPSRGPRPAYRTFGRPAFPEARFEPSGVARLADGRLLVVNDKDDAPRFAVFGRSRSGLVELAAFDLPGEIRKLEDVTGSLRSPGEVLALTSFESYPDASNDRLVRVKVGKSGKLAFSEDVPLFDPKAWTADRLGLPYAKAEAVALGPDERRLFVGLRIVGPEDNVGEPRVLVLEYDAERPERPPRAAVDVDLEPVVGRPEGISGLEYAPRLGAYLLTTSFEAEEGSGADSVGGHLWLIPGPLEMAKAPEAWRSLPRLALDHKPEGVTELDDGRILVVFDDDQDRKSLDDPTKFSLARHEAAYAVIDPARFETSPYRRQ